MNYPDPEVLAIHYREAGWYPEASRYFALAGDQSAGVLAFDRASALYRLAIELGPRQAAVSRGLRIKLGDALANAGRGGEAAGEYLAAAIDDSAESLDLRRRAALQYLISGRVDEGLATLRGVVGSVGMRIPRSSWETLCFLARGAGLVPAPRNLFQPSSCRRCSPAGSHANRHLLVRLHRIIDHRSHPGGGLPGAQSPPCSPRGEPRRIVRALAMEAAHVACTASPPAVVPQGCSRPPSLPHAWRPSRIRRESSSSPGRSWPTSRVGGKKLAAFAEPAEATSAIIAPEWPGRSIRRGSSRSGALNYLGEIGELRRRWTELMKDAKERDDMYMTGTLGTLMMTIVRLADDNLAAAEDELRQVSRLWSRQGFHIQHHNRVLASCLISLYRGDNAETWERLETLRPTYARSLLLRVQTIRVELYRFRAGVLWRRRGWPTIPTGSCRKRRASPVGSTREPFPRRPPMRCRSAPRSQRRRSATSEARSLFEGAIDAYRELGMSLFAAAAQRSLGSLLGGDEGRAHDRSGRSVDDHRRASATLPGWPRSMFAQRLIASDGS